MQVRLITDYDAFLALAPDWNRLHEESAPGDPFLSHQWCDSAWQWRRETAELYVLCCEIDGRIAGIMPLVRPRPATGGIRSVEFLAVPDTQRCDILALPEARERVIGGLANALLERQRDWDALRLRYLPRDALATTRFAALLLQRGCRCETSTSTNPWIDLSGNWAAFMTSRSRRLKKATNLAANRLTRAGSVGIDWLEPGAGTTEDVTHALDAATSISARSWKVRTGNSLDNAGPGSFLRRLAQHAHRRGWLSIWTLSLDRRPIAMEIQLIAGGNAFALRSDFDAAYDEISPGSHLSRCMLEKLFGRSLARYFMGPGDNPYKYRWAEGADEVHALTVYGRSLRGRSLAALELVVKPIARKARDRLKGKPAPGADEDRETAGSMKRGSQ
jgi:CelD/BcsL family acetyltransferase involved in cellulose biosynthesis